MIAVGAMFLVTAVLFVAAVLFVTVGMGRSILVRGCVVMGHVLSIYPMGV